MCVEAFDRVGMRGHIFLPRLFIFKTQVEQCHGLFGAAGAERKEVPSPERCESVWARQATFILMPATGGNNTAAGQVFYQPSLEGFEGNGTQVARRREAQMEALVDCGCGTSRSADHWTDWQSLTDGCNTLGIVGEQLAAARSHTLATTPSSSGAEPECRKWFTWKHYAAYRKVETPIHHLIQGFTRASGASRTDASYSIACHIN